MIIFANCELVKAESRLFFVVPRLCRQSLGTRGFRGSASRWSMWSVARREGRQSLTSQCVPSQSLGTRGKPTHAVLEVQPGDRNTGGETHGERYSEKARVPIYRARAIRDIIIPNA